MKLADFIKPDIEKARSINLERDRGHGPALLSYQITSKGCEILSRFIQALRGECVSAWSLTGPYGMGKSAFANFLLACTGPNSAKETMLALARLQECNKGLAKDFRNAVDEATQKRGFIRIPITAGFEPVNKSIVMGVRHALDNSQFESVAPAVIQELKAEWLSLSQQDQPDSQSLKKGLSALRMRMQRPILMIIDEFGKNLEYMAHHPDKGDIFIIQLLAETTGIFLWVCLHQAFEGYAAGLTAQQRREWSKVQGRFEDIAFIESTSQMLALTRRVLVQKPDKRLQAQVNQWAKRCRDASKRARIPFVEDMTESEIASLYPLPPITAIVLPELCRRFAQNDRTLFAFLCGGDPIALPRYIRNQEITDRLPFVGLDYLYDYFFSVSTTAYINRPEAQRWIEIQDIINQAYTLSPVKQAILKTIGVLNLISGPLSLPAKEQIILAALQDPLGMSPSAIKTELSELAQLKTLIYREYAQEYRLWEGSDFDIVGAIWKKRNTLAMRPLAETLQALWPRQSLTASRHSYKTGTVRRFECQWMSVDELISCKAPAPNVGYDGLIVYAFGNQPQVQNLPYQCSDKRPLLIAYAAHENQIKELVLEAAAARAVFLESPELIHDAVARKEARFRVQAAEDQLREYLSQIYEPNAQESHWYIGSDIIPIHSHRDLSKCVSDLCDKAYASCPPIGNEMISYDQLSGSASAARRALAEAMVMHASEDQLGLSGYGPEVAVYRSLFRSTGLHKWDGEQWRFVKPDASSNKELAQVWQEIDSLLESAHDSPYGMSVRTIIDRLKEPPFGLREGTIPLFLCHYIIVNADEIALYNEGAYKPYFGDAEITLMIKRPELFSLRHYASTGLGREVVQAYMQVLNTDILELKPRVRNPSLLKIVTPLIQFMEGLSEYTRHTRNLSMPAQRLRTAVLNAREPIKLLFEDIPDALGIEIIDHGMKPSAAWRSDLRGNLQDALLELNAAFDKLNITIQDAFMQAFHWDQAGDQRLSAFHESLKNRVEGIFKHCADPDLKPLLRAILNDANDDAEWIRGIAGRILKKPVDAWRDGDFEPFQAALFELADRIESLTKLVGSGIGLENQSGLVLSIMRSDGEVHRRVVQMDAKRQAQLKERHRELLNMPQEERDILCAMLLNASTEAGK